MNKFYWKKYTEPTDLTLIKHEMLIELNAELKQAQYNNNWKRASFLKKQIEQIENIKS